MIKNCLIEPVLIETVLLITHNTFLGCEIKKIFFCMRYWYNVLSAIQLRLRQFHTNAQFKIRQGFFIEFKDPGEFKIRSRSPKLSLSSIQKNCLSKFNLIHTTVHKL